MGCLWNLLSFYWNAAVMQIQTSCRACRHLTLPNGQEQKVHVEKLIHTHTKAPVTPTWFENSHLHVVAVWSWMKLLLSVSVRSPVCSALHHQSAASSHWHAVTVFLLVQTTNSRFRYKLSLLKTVNFKPSSFSSDLFIVIFLFKILERTENCIHRKTDCIQLWQCFYQRVSSFIWFEFIQIKGSAKNFMSSMVLFNKG